VREHLESRPLREAIPRKSWTPPQIEDLPRLETLTLQTGVSERADSGADTPA